MKEIINPETAFHNWNQWAIREDWWIEMSRHIRHWDFYEPLYPRLIFRIAK
jgi:hypothetical protein